MDDARHNVKAVASLKLVILFITTAHQVLLYLPLEPRRSHPIVKMEKAQTRKRAAHN